MKLLVWNIKQGGSNRRAAIASSIAKHNPDMIGLLEFVPNGSKLDKDWLGSEFRNRVYTEQNGKGYAVCIASKHHIVRSPCTGLLQDSGLWLEVLVPACSFSLGLLHVPTKIGTKGPFCKALVDVAESNAGKNFLFAGDFNTGVHPADGDLKSLGGAPQFAAILNAGFTDAWRHFHADSEEFSYEHSNKKQYRIDHALASATLTRRLTACRYSHDERLAKESDHSLLTVEFTT